MRRLISRLISQFVEEATIRSALDDHIGSLLDLVITDSKARVLVVKNQAILGSLSRCHSVLNWKFAVGRMSNEIFRLRRRLLNENYIGMSEKILEIHWDKLFFDKDIDS